MMTKKLLNLGVVCAVLCFSIEAVAQGDTRLSTRTAKLQELSEKRYKRDENNHQRATEFTRRVGIPLKRNLPGEGGTGIATLWHRFQANFLHHQ